LAYSLGFNEVTLLMNIKAYLLKSMTETGRDRVLRAGPVGSNLTAKPFGRVVAVGRYE
jgi:hypothetical protein